MVWLVRHCQTKGAETDSPNLNHYASSLLYPFLRPSFLTKLMYLTMIALSVYDLKSKTDKNDYHDEMKILYLIFNLTFKASVV